MPYDSIVFALAAIIFALCYLFEDKERILLKDLFMILSLGMILAALVYGSNLNMTSTITTATGNVTGVTTVSNTIYNYTASSAATSPLTSVPVIVIFIFIFVIVYQFFKDMIHEIGHSGKRK